MNSLNIAPKDSGPWAISLKNVCFSYQDSLVLNDITFDIGSKEFIGMIGPNGGGKTTLLKLMMGFLKPTTGKITVFGELPMNVQNQMAYVPQSLRFDRQFPISVFELVLGGRLSHLPWYGTFSQSDKQAALDALKQVHLTEYKDRAFGTLSGGQAQRALIARALASSPRILLLDEPTASVDAQAEADIYALLKELRGHIAIIMVTHDLRAAVELVDRVVCVQQTAVSLDPKEVCEHFAFGLYHPRLK